MMDLHEGTNQAAMKQGSGEAARKMYADFARGDIDSVVAGFHPEIEWREAEGNPYQPDGRPFRGSQEIVERLFVRLGEEWDSFSVIPQHFHEGVDGTVVVEGRYTGTFLGTGRALDCEVCHVLSYAGGKLIAFRQYVDTAALQKAMGVQDWPPMRVR